MTADLVAYLAALNTEAANRIYQRTAPQRAAYPLIIVTRVSGASGLDLSGADGHGSPRFQVDVYGSGLNCLPQIQRIAHAISSALHGFHGSMGMATVLCISKVNEQDLDDIDGDQVLRRILQDYRVTYREA